MPQTLSWADMTRSPYRFEQRTFGWDTAFPPSWREGGWFIRTDLNTIYQNTGTELAPTWSLRGGSAGDHDHNDATTGGVLDADTTRVTVGTQEISLLELVII